MRLHIVSALTILGTVLVAVPARAETVINNQVSVSANSGGNSASNGTKIEGQSKSRVQIYSEVNGEVVIDKEWITTSTGEPVVIKESRQVESSSYQVKTDIEVSINSSQTKEESAVLENKSVLEDLEIGVGTTTTQSSKTRSIVERLWRIIINNFSYYANWLRK